MSILSNTTLIDLHEHIHDMDDSDWCSTLATRPTADYRYQISLTNLRHRYGVCIGIDYEDGVWISLLQETKPYGEWLPVSHRPEVILIPNQLGEHRREFGGVTTFLFHYDMTVNQLVDLLINQFPAKLGYLRELRLSQYDEEVDY